MEIKELQTIQVGDDVCLTQNNHPATVHKVKRISKTQIVLGVFDVTQNQFELKFCRKTGFKINKDPMNRTTERICVVSQQEKDMIIKQHRITALVNAYENIDWDTVPLEVLEQVCDILVKNSILFIR